MSNYYCSCEASLPEDLRENPQTCFSCGGIIRGTKRPSRESLPPSPNGGTAERIPQERLDLLRERAKAAPAGPYHSDTYRLYGPTPDEDKRRGPCFFEWKHSDAGFAAEQAGELAAVCDPETILGLLDEIESLRGARADPQPALASESGAGKRETP